MSVIDCGGFGKIYVVADGAEEFVIKKGLDRDISQEAKIYGKLRGIPGLPRLYDYWAESELVMVKQKEKEKEKAPQTEKETGKKDKGPSKYKEEIVRFGYLRLEQLGLSLRRMARLQTLKAATICEWGCQLVRTLNLIHRRGIVHRDVKPDNIVCGLRETSNRVYLVDFGLATPYRKFKQYPKGYFCGTPGYSSQNVNRHMRASYRDDMESLGYSLYYLMHRPLTVPANEVKDYGHFEPFIRYCRKLAYEEIPDPEILCMLLQRFEPASNVAL